LKIPIWRFFAFLYIRTMMANSTNYAQSEYLGSRRVGYEKSMRSKAPVFPEVVWVSIPRSGRAE
jgi:hypothetical protein